VKKSLLILALVFWAPAWGLAHTTTLIPHCLEKGIDSIKVIHFNPSFGDDIMGIRLGVKDSPVLKGLEEIYVIHKGEKQSLNEAVTADFCTVRELTRETYSIPISRKNGFFRAGDYIIVVQHAPHWKKQLDYYQMKIGKSFINYGGLITDWPHKVLDNMPEIIPLVPPFQVYPGTLFQAEAVNEKGERIPHAKILIEYLNYPLAGSALDTAIPLLANRQLVNTSIFADAGGTFSFIPPREGVWTFTLMDGDDGQNFNGKKVRYDSSISILVHPNQ